jgi:hypothetical protein
MLTEQPAQNVLAARFASEFLPMKTNGEPRSPDERQRNPGPAIQARKPLPDFTEPVIGPATSGRTRWLHPGHERRGGGTPADAYLQPPHPQPSSFRLRGRTEAGARRASGGTRSPVGVPPRLLLRRTNATAQLRLRASWDSSLDGCCPPKTCPSPASSSQTGHSAGRAYSRSRPGPRSYRYVECISMGYKIFTWYRLNVSGAGEIYR